MVRGFFFDFMQFLTTCMYRISFMQETEIAHEIDKNAHEIAHAQKKMKVAVKTTSILIEINSS